MTDQKKTTKQATQPTQEKKKSEEVSLEKLGEQAISLNEEKIAKASGFSSEQIAIARRTVAKDANLVELAFFMNVAKSQGLNPFNKEIWCYKDYKHNLIIFAGRDGMLRKAQENPNFAGIRSCEVREKDDFKADIPNGKILHEFTSVNTQTRGKIVGAYCFVFRKDGEPTLEVVDIETFDKESPKFSSPWKTHKADMIKKVAEHRALKKAFGFSSLQNEEDFYIKNGVAYPVNSSAKQLDAETVDADFKDLAE